MHVPSKDCSNVFTYKVDQQQGKDEQTKQRSPHPERSIIANSKDEIASPDQPASLNRSQTTFEQLYTQFPKFKDFEPSSSFSFGRRKSTRNPQTSIEQPTTSPMDDSSFKDLKNQIQRASISNEKRRILNVAAETHYFTASQVVQLIKEAFTVADDQLHVVEATQGRIVDRNNLHIILEAFTSTSKEMAKKILE